jgi:methylenetetrahydrofolate dehydrogenase (NADP+)/methenyltetrahydrofolate cyclohydrolase
MKITTKTLQKEHLSKFKAIITDLDRKPHLVVILVWSNPASLTYVGHKEKIAKEIGATISVHQLPTESTFENVRDIIIESNNDREVDAILLQMPLPDHLKSHTRTLLDLIKSHKDVDGLTTSNLGALISWKENSLVACTPQAVMNIAETHRSDLAGKHMVILGRSEIVGKPLIHLALRANMSVTTLHSHSKNVQALTKKADILVVAVGRPDTITDDDIKDGALIIDVGINKQDGKLIGDTNIIDQERVDVTAVPGGVGPMTVTYVMHNLLAAYEANNKCAGKKDRKRRISFLSQVIFSFFFSSPLLSSLDTQWEFIALRF